MNARWRLTNYSQICASYSGPGLLLVLAALVAGCAGGPVGTDTAGGTAALATSMPGAPVNVPLDVGIGIFDPGIGALDPDQRITTPSVRRVEAHYMPYVLAQTLVRRGQWGAVKVIPDKQSEMDVWIAGEILESDGKELALRITVSDTTGRQWYVQKYAEEVNRYVYDPDPTVERQDPFQRIYERIADDLAQALRGMSADELAELQAVSQLQFAQRFAPEQFADYLAPDGRGRLSVKRLPAAADPAMQTIESIRSRDRMFVDQLQEYYRSFAAEMQTPYDQWRKASLDEVEAMNSLKAEGLARKIGGALAVLGGILAQTTGDSAVGTAGIVGIAGGAYLFKSGMDKSADARFHEATLNEMAESLGADMKPLHITLRDRSVTLSGTVEEQYQQWRGLLREIYLTETGQAPPPNAEMEVATDRTVPAPP